MQWNRDIGSFIILAVLLVVLFLLFSKRKSLGIYVNYVIAAIGITVLVDITAFIIRVSPNISNTYILYLYLYGMLFAFFLVVFLMFRELVINALLKKIATGIVFVFLLNFGIQLFFIDLKEGFPTNLQITNVFLLLSAIAIFFLDTFKTDLVLEIKNYFPFWFSLGLIIVYVGMIPLIVVSKISESVMTNGLWLFVSFLINILGYGLILVGLINAKKIVQ